MGVVVGMLVGWGLGWTFGFALGRLVRKREEMKATRKNGRRWSEGGAS